MISLTLCIYVRKPLSNCLASGVVGEVRGRGGGHRRGFNKIKARPFVYILEWGEGGGRSRTRTRARARRVNQRFIIHLVEAVRAFFRVCSTVPRCLVRPRMCGNESSPDGATAASDGAAAAGSDTSAAPSAIIASTSEGACARTPST